MMPASRYLPFAPLLRYIELHYRHDLDQYDDRGNGPISNGRIAEVCGVSRDAVLRFKAKGVAFYRGDAIAKTLGVHPWTIWGDVYFDVPIARSMLYKSRRAS